jgi:hypothetical protein
MVFPPGPDFPALLVSITRILEKMGLPFMLIGRQAVLLHGRPRLTEDIDVTLGAGPERLADVMLICETLSLRPLPEDVEAFVHQTFVLPALHQESGVLGEITPPSAVSLAPRPATSLPSRPA